MLISHSHQKYFRFLAGKIVDYPCVNKVLFHQVSFLFSGIIPMLMLLTPHLSGFEFNSLVILALVLGCFDGIFVSLWVPIANEFCGNLNMLFILIISDHLRKTFDKLKFA